jgi:hypothetical protein
MIQALSLPTKKGLNQQSSVNCERIAPERCGLFPLMGQEDEMTLRLRGSGLVLPNLKGDGKGDGKGEPPSGSAGAASGANEDRDWSKQRSHQLAHACFEKQKRACGLATPLPTHTALRTRCLLFLLEHACAS